MDTAQRARRINEILAHTYPDAHCTLDFKNPFQLTVATVLSAQTTDVRVNQVTPELFAAYPTPCELAKAPEKDVEKIIHPLGLAPSKAQRLVGIGKKLVSDFGGEVPTRIDDLTSLPGVGRKTALVVRGDAFHLPGLAVDTHVKRVSTRLGLAAGTTEPKIEKELCELLPRTAWTMFSHRLILHGRQCCTARKPSCALCPVRKLCSFPVAEFKS